MTHWQCLDRFFCLVGFIAHLAGVGGPSHFIPFNMLGSASEGPFRALSELSEGRNGMCISSDTEASVLL